MYTKIKLSADYTIGCISTPHDMANCNSTPHIEYTMIPVASETVNQLNHFGWQLETTMLAELKMRLAAGQLSLAQPVLVCVQVTCDRAVKYFEETIADITENAFYTLSLDIRNWLLVELMCNTKYTALCDGCGQSLAGRCGHDS